MPENSPASLPPAKHRKTQIFGCISGVIVIGERSFNNVVVISEARVAGLIIDWESFGNLNLHPVASKKHFFFKNSQHLLC
jgi:hypothetical protein